MPNMASIVSAVSIQLLLPKQHEPKMIAAWLSTVDNIYMENDGGFDFRYTDNKKIADELHDLLFGRNEYGVKTSISPHSLTDAYEAVIKACFSCRRCHPLVPKIHSLQSAFLAHP